jgi:PAS domain S-box-containing protein
MAKSPTRYFLAIAAVAVVFALRLGLMRAGYSFSQALFQPLLLGIDGLVVVYLTFLMRRDREAAQDANRQLRRANEEVRRAEARTHELLELAPDAFFQSDLRAHFTDVNQAACRLLGYTREELLTKTIFDVLTEEDAPRLKAVREQLLVPGGVERAEWIHKRKDGTLVPLEVSANILPDGRWQAFARDVSERRRIEDEREELLTRERVAREQAESANARLRESEERFRLTIEDAPIGMALVALDGRFVRVNHALCEITGYSPEELTARTFQAITHPDDVEADVAASGRLTRGEILRYRTEKRYLRKDGSAVDVQLNVSVLRSPSGAPLYYISQIEDITERKHAEAALRRAMTARDHVLGVVAHDLRSPLASILLSVTLAQREHEPERLVKPLGTIARAATRMDHLIQGLLDVSLIEAGQLKIEPERVRTADLVLQAVESQTSLASSSGLELRIDLARDVDDLWASRERLHEVFENLIGNAIKFTEAGGRITVGAASRDQDVLFWVADTGRGIAPENLPKIFDRFWQAVPRTGRLGAGLGLAITKGIVEAHGGRIWVESTAGRGSTFFFTIPRTGPDTAHSREAVRELKA